MIFVWVECTSQATPSGELRDPTANGGEFDDLNSPQQNISPTVTSKISSTGKISDAIAKIRLTKEGLKILEYLESNEQILSVVLRKGGLELGETIVDTYSKILEEPRFWEVLKETKRIDLSNISIRINMGVKDPSLFASDGTKFMPSLTRIVAHELGHAYNFARYGSGRYRHNSIKIENTIMRQLDSSSTIRHKSLGHRGIGSQF